MSVILSLSGLSGAGKTTLAKLLLKEHDGARMVESITTRAPRASDIKGEYRYVDRGNFSLRARQRNFLWQTTFAGNRYGTEARAIADVFASEEERIGLMILVPNVLPLLSEFLHSIGHGHRLVSVFVTVPRAELRARLSARGDDIDSINKRFAAESAWEVKAKASSIDFHYVENSGSIETTLASILSLV